jgi:pumilio RNA-binding family
MLEHCDEPQIRPVLNEVFERVLDLTRDMYGNYVISHVLEHGAPSDKLFVISKIKKKVLMLSTHKFGSNVIEKCLVHSEKRQKEDIINEIIQVRVSVTDNESTNGGESKSDNVSRSSNNNVITLQDIMRDKYGNYVIQRVVDISNESQRKQLIEKILKAAASMKKHKSHARHVFTFLEKSYGITIVYDDDSNSKKGANERKSSGAVTKGKTSDL